MLPFIRKSGLGKGMWTESSLVIAQGWRRVGDGGMKTREAMGLPFEVMKMFQN